MTTSSAVKELRKTFGESQQAFAGRVGLSIASIAHYEGGQRFPDYLVTLKLYRAARQSGRKDLAAFFLQSINAVLPLEELVGPVKASLSPIAKHKKECAPLNRARYRSPSTARDR